MKGSGTSKESSIEGDDSIFLRLRKIDRLSLPEHVTSFHCIDAELLMQIVAKVLECITGVHSEYSGRLPLNIASRHRVCTAFAAEIKKLGFKGECGYNQLLYPVEAQTRVLLSWLVKRLPRGQDVRVDENIEPTALLYMTISKKLVDWKQQRWRHPSCLYGVPPRNVYNIEPLQTLQVDLTNYSIFDIYSNCADLGISAESSILEKHSLEIIQDCRYSSLLESDFNLATNFLGKTRSGGPKFHQLSSNRSDSNVKSLFSSAFGKFNKAAEFSASLSDEVGPDDESLRSAASVKTAIVAPDLGDHEKGIAIKEAEEAAKRTEIIALEHEIQNGLKDLKAMEIYHTEVTTKMSSIDEKLVILSTESENLERQVLVKRKTLELIPFAGDNIIKLEDICASIISETAALTALWELERAPLLRDLQMKRHENEKRHNKCQHQVEDMKTMREEMTSMMIEIKEKENKSQMLAQELADMPDNLTRAAYTYRIMDIIASLSKQTKEIEKITADIHDLQKHLNSTASSLERADAVAEEMIFLAASTDSRSQEKTESYRRLRTLRLRFNETVDAVAKVGQLEKLSRDLETKIEEERGRSSEAGFRQISLDLEEIRNENEDLMSKIKSVAMS